MFNVEKFTKQLIAESGWSPAEAPKFAAWWAKVDAIVESKLHLGTGNIGDWDYASAFEDGRSPASAAKEVVSLYLRGEL